MLYATSGIGLTRSLCEKILLGGVVQLNNVKNEQALRLVVKRLAENVEQPPPIVFGY